MSGAVFLVDVIAFVIVVMWACAADAPGRRGEKGLLGMKLGAGEDASRRPPRWSRAPSGTAVPARRLGGKAKPGWRRTLAPRPARFDR